MIREPAIYQKGQFYVQLTDIQGRKLLYQSIQQVEDKLWRIQLVPYTPSWLFIMVHDSHFLTSGGLFIPSD
jgi:hypothetical protein